mmetsp:Transcript_5627/g.21285  ORF Transcript_5627/g.21285 Transcript_5627/m.21285 type:complete len:169 (+) Transcript_5627:2-508(+)
MMRRRARLAQAVRTGSAPTSLYWALHPCSIMAEGESLEQLEARHGEEEQELEDKIRSHVEAATAGAPKGKKAKAALEAAEREADQWRYDLTVRHQEERDALEESAGGGKGVSGGGDDAEAGKAGSSSQNGQRTNLSLLGPPSLQHHGRGRELGAARGAARGGGAGAGG